MFVFFGPFIVMIGDDIGMRQLERVEIGEPIAPDAGGEGLVGIDLAAPGEGLFEQGEAFVAIIGIAGFVV